MLNLQFIKSESNLNTFKQLLRQKGRVKKTERQTDKETERQSQKDRKTEGQKDRETERQRDRKTERQKDRTTERQKDRRLIVILFRSFLDFFTQVRERHFFPLN